MLNSRETLETRMGLEPHRQSVLYPPLISWKKAASSLAEDLP